MSFNRWLLQQTDHPYGPIADIADAALQDSNWPAIACLDDMLEYLKKDESDTKELVRKSMCYAWCEYTYESSGCIIDAPRLSFICAMIASIDDEDDEDYRQDLLEDRRLFDMERSEMLAASTL
jgi:hypothetical protein